MAPRIHYGSHGTAECGADVPNMGLTTVAAHVTCPTCRGWLPIVAPELQREIQPGTDAGASAPTLRVIEASLAMEEAFAHFQPAPAAAASVPVAATDAGASAPPCPTCGGGGFIATKRFIDDGYGDVDSCPEVPQGRASRKRLELEACCTVTEREELIIDRAQETADRIIAAAHRDAEQIRNQAHVYAKHVLAGTKLTLLKLVESIRI